MSAAPILARRRFLGVPDDQLHRGLDAPARSGGPGRVVVCIQTGSPTAEPLGRCADCLSAICPHHAATRAANPVRQDGAA